jgi:hypothetical protein
MIPKSGNRFSEKIMLKQEAKALLRFNLKQSRFSTAPSQWTSFERRPRQRFAAEAFVSKQPLRSDRELQFFCGPEGDLLAGLDLDGLAGRGVASHAGCTLPDLENPQTGDANPLTFLQVLGDQAHEIAEQSLATFLGQFVLSSQGRGEVL